MPRGGTDPIDVVLFIITIIVNAGLSSCWVAARYRSGGAGLTTAESESTSAISPPCL
jgi:hypothetical protein